MANLLDRASVVLTPTAYNNGEALCIKPDDASGDFQFSRNSAATRVNAQGLVENVQILSSNLVQNGDFSEEGAEEVSNGSFTNGSTDWALGTGWSIGEDKVVADNVSSNTIQNLSSIDANKSYNISFNISDYLGGQFFITFGGNDNTINFTANGSYSVYINPLNAVNNIFYLRGNGFSGSITNISVKEVGQNWAAKDGVIVSANSSGLVFDNSTGNASGGVFQNIGLSDANKYQMTATMQLLTGASNGTFTVFSSSANGTSQSQIYTGSTLVVGGNAVTETFEFSPASGDVSIQFTCDEANATYNVSNVNVIQITDDTNLPRISYENFSYQDALGSEEIVNGDFSNGSANWAKNGNVTISGGTANFNNSASGNNVQQPVTLPSGKQYIATYEITSITDGKFSIYVGGVLSGNQNNQVGVYTEVFTSIGVNQVYVRARGTTSGSIDNVSVKEYSGQIPIPNSGCGSWLFEPQTTQLLSYSEDFSQWNAGGDTTIESGYLAPDGTNNAYKVSGTSSALLIDASLLTTTTRSIYARTVSGSGTISLLSKNDNTNNTFTLTEQWQRFEVNSANTTGASSFYAVDFRNPSDTLSEVILWGANATNDQDYATSYIPSNGSQVTRNQDVCNNGGSLATINSTEGTLYAEIRKDVSQTTFRLISLNNAASNSDANSVAIGYANGGSDFYLRVKSPSGGFTSQNIPASNNEFHKIAIRYEQANIGIFIDGIKEVTYTGNYLFTQPLDNLSFDYNGNGGLPFFGKTKALAVWKEALTDQELTELTTI